MHRLDAERREVLGELLRAIRPELGEQEAHPSGERRRVRGLRGIAHPKIVPVSDCNAK
jgi:hypothetical protein